MIDHTGVSVSDFEASKAFYVAALAPIGYGKLLEFGPEITGSVSVAGFGEPPKPDFWISPARPTARPSTSPSAWATARRCARSTPRRWPPAAPAMARPGIRAHYHPNYYGAFVHDPDGHNIEAVCHEPEEP